MATTFSLLNSLLPLTLTIVGISAYANEAACPKFHGGARLVTVSIFDGPPSEHADLMPDRFRTTKDGSSSEWDVAYVFQAGRKLFVECKYGKKAAPVVMKPSPRTTKCTFIDQDRGPRSLTCVFPSG